MMNKDLKKLVEEAKCITFDIFDTLLFRNVKSPLDIFKFVELTYKYTYKSDLDIFKLRLEAEDLARKKYEYSEVNFDEIYLEVEKFTNTEIANRIRSLEENAEIDFCSVNPEMYEVYKYALELNKPIYIISDMYLPKEILRKMLSACGYSGYLEIFVSGEYHRTKQAGDLFNIVLSKIGIKPENILHIGDNKVADVKRPKEYGIKSFWYRRKEKKIDYLEQNIFTDGIEIEADSIRQFIINKLDSSKSKEYQLGYSVFGIFLYGAVSWLHKSVDTIDRLLFCSRDGYILKKGYEQFLDRNIDYFYCSRKSIIGASTCDDKSIIETIQRYKSWPAKFNLFFLMDRMGISGAIHDDRDITFDELLDDDFIKTLDDIFFHIVKENSKEQKKMFMKYWNYLTNGNKVIGIVDYGGNRSIEKSLREIIPQDMNKIISFNIGISDEVTENVLAYLYSAGKNNLLERSIQPFYYFFEIFLSAPHGSVKKYKDYKDKIYPEFEEYDYHKDKHFEKMIFDLQDGALKFVEDFKALGERYFNIRPELSISMLYNFGMYPTKNDFEKWRHFKFNANEYVQLVQFSWSDFFNLKNLITLYRNSLWKAGFIKSILRYNFLTKIFWKLRKYE